MRREWTGWIRERKWREFESLAKTDPSQPLADTVAELEIGFPDKADRKALRKVLFLLARQGYHPRDIEEREEAPATPEVREDFAFATGPDANGIATLSYCRHVGGKCRMFFADYGDDFVQRAEDSEMTPEKASLLLREVTEILHETPNYGRVSTDFARWRLSQVMNASRQILPSTATYWRAFLDDASATGHPADLLPFKSASCEDLREFLSEPFLPRWEVPYDLLQPVARVVFADALVQKWNFDQFRAEVQKRVNFAREELVTDKVIRLHVLRLKDMAYIWKTRNEPSSEMALAVADDLETRGNASEYATLLVQRAFERIVRARENVNLMVRTDSADEHLA